MWAVVSGLEDSMKYKLIKDIEREDGWIIPAGIEFVQNPRNGEYEGLNPVTKTKIRLGKDMIEEFGDEYLEEVEATNI